MLSVADAQALILRQVPSPKPVAVALAECPVGAVLAEDVASDLDSPPYDKALMDGYAVRAVDLQGGPATLTVIEEIMAGRVPTKALGQGQATRIMTGAPLPANCDAVVVVERTQALANQQVRIDDGPVKGESNLLRRGREMRRGEVILRVGTRLWPQEIGLLATVGRATVRVYPSPRVAVIATGDEIVEVEQTPGPGQIRNGNGPMLVAQVQRTGGQARWVGIARDTQASLRETISDGLRDDVLLLTGGVSAGKLDLVPEVLRELGVETQFHKVAMKPGKPALFGTRGRTLVFALPGNPVSALVCFELFVRPALRAMRGLEAGPKVIDAALTESFVYRTDRPTYYPARLQWEDAGARVTPCAWFGSADLRGLTAANALLVVPVGVERFAAGQKLPVLGVEEKD